MHDLIRKFLFLALTLLWQAGAAGQQTNPADSAATLIRAFMAESGTPGIAVSVGRNGRIVWSEGFGYADVEQRVPVSPSLTRFRVGSVAKPMTATALAQLLEAGKLDLDAPVQTYVPNFPEKKKGRITTRQLAGHLAGIRHYRGDEFLGQKHYGSVAEGLTIFQNDTLLFEPGTAYSYSSYGWNLVSAVVEGASGEEFLGYMQAHIFRPLGMQQTIADHVTPIISNRTRYYVFEDGELLNAPPVDNSYKWAGGGFLSTSEDLVKFGFAHLSTQYLKPETIALLWQSQHTTAGEATNYGIGWASGNDARGRRINEVR